jgi:hypothetical protein
MLNRDETGKPKFPSYFIKQTSKAPTLIQGRAQCHIKGRIMNRTVQDNKLVRRRRTDHNPVRVIAFMRSNLSSYREALCT